MATPLSFSKVLEMVVNKTFKQTSTVSRSAQTTIPSSIRSHLGIKDGDKVQYEITATGEVIFSRAASEENESDPVMLAFLSYLEKTILEEPEILVPFPPDLAERMQAIAAQIDTGDPDAALPEDAPDEP